jgi:hypothetical protein
MEARLKRTPTVGNLRLQKKQSTPNLQTRLRKAVSSAALRAPNSTDHKSRDNRPVLGNVSVNKPHKPRQTITDGTATSTGREDKRMAADLSKIVEDMDSLSLNRAGPSIADLAKSLRNLDLDLDPDATDVLQLAKRSGSGALPIANPQIDTAAAIDQQQHSTTPVRQLIEPQIWLTVSFRSQPRLATGTMQLQPLTLLATKVPTLKTLQDEILRAIRDACGVRRRELPEPNHWSFRVRSDSVDLAYHVGQPCRDMLEDGEPIYQAFLEACLRVGDVQCGLLEEMLVRETDGGGGDRLGALGQRLAQLGALGSVCLLRVVGSCEVWFPLDGPRLLDGGFDDLPM